MSSEETVLNPYVTITPRNPLRAYRLWISLPKYRLRSILECKPVFLKIENIKSAQLTNLVWTITSANDDYEEIVIHADHDEVRGGFEKLGPGPTPWHRIAKHYVVRSPSILTILLIMLLYFIASQVSAQFKTEEFLNQYSLYHQYPKEFLSIVKTRIIFWSFLLPTSLAPFVVALMSLSGFWRSRIGRIHSAVKIESWLMLFIGLILIKNFPISKIVHQADTLFAPLSSSKIEKTLQEQQSRKN
jgi:hypothetical protein